RSYKNQYRSRRQCTQPVEIRPRLLSKTAQRHGASASTDHDQVGNRREMVCVLSRVECSPATSHISLYTMVYHRYLSGHSVQHIQFHQKIRAKPCLGGYGQGSGTSIGHPSVFVDGLAGIIASEIRGDRKRQCHGRNGAGCPTLGNRGRQVFKNWFYASAVQS